MATTFKNYDSQFRYGLDYHRLRKFYLELTDPIFSYGRWDWMISHTALDEQGLSRIGLWQDCDEIVAVVTYDIQIDGNCYLLWKPGYDFLQEEMIDYAQKNLSYVGHFYLLISDIDLQLQRKAQKLGYHATKHKECDQVMATTENQLAYCLPAGFSITSMKENFDLHQYGKVLWNGFNHELNGEGIYNPTKQNIEAYRNEFLRPHVNCDLKIAIQNAKGHFVSYCGMWYDPASQYAIIEPVATDPRFRKMGLAKAVVFEAMARCGRLGAKRAYVGSSKQFYTKLGFQLSRSATFWCKLDK